jgi:hypothetical protein
MKLNTATDMGGALLVRNSPSGKILSGTTGSSAIFECLITIRENIASGATLSTGEEVPMNLALGKIVTTSNVYQANNGIATTFALTDGNIATAIRLRKYHMNAITTSWIVLDLGKEYDIRLVRITRGNELGTKYGGFGDGSNEWDYEENYSIRVASEASYVAPVEHTEWYNSFTLCHTFAYLGKNQVGQIDCSVANVKHRYVVVHRKKSDSSLPNIIPVDITNSKYTQIQVVVVV